MKPDSSKDMMEMDAGDRQDEGGVAQLRRSTRCNGGTGSLPWWLASEQVKQLEAARSL